MKRLTLIIIGVLLCTPLYSDMNPYIAGVPVSGGGGCMGGTYTLAWNGDYPSDTDKACKADGSTTVDGTQSGGTLDSTAFVATAKDQYVEYAITTSEFNEDEGTLFIEVYIEPDAVGNVYFFEILNAANFDTNSMVMNYSPTGNRFHVGRRGGGETDNLDDVNCTITPGVWTTVGVSWSVGRETQDWSISDDSGANWYGDGVDGIATMANAPDVLRMGNLREPSNNHGYRIARWAVVSGYQGACPW